MTLERFTGRALALLALLCGAVFAVWMLHPEPVEMMYKFFSTSPTGERETIYPYFLGRMAWPSAILGALSLGLAALFLRRPEVITDSERTDGFLTPGMALFLASALTLYFEILGIRWWGSEMRSLAYFKNLTLICAFLGLGGGMLLKGSRRDLLPYFPICFGLLTFLAVSAPGKILGRLDVPGAGIFFYFQSWAENSGLRALVFCAFIVLVVSLQVGCFIPLGQFIARQTNKLPPIKGYSLNIFGSLVGLLAFSAMSFLSLPSWSWFAVGCGGFLLLAAALHARRLLVLEAVLCALSVVAVAIGDAGSLWSPYYKVETVPWDIDVVCSDAFKTHYYKDLPRGKIPWGYGVSYNALYFVNGLDASEAFISKYPQYRECRKELMPQNLVALDYFPPTDQETLIIASGPGNDVAIFLERGAKHIDAVDIDPLAIKLSKRLHPQDPYSDPRVTTTIDDARAFLQRSKKKYQYVLFASLDAQTLLSGMSSIRLDNFIYTTEAFKAAKNVMTDDGVLVIVYWGLFSFVPDRFEAMLLESFPPDQVWRKGVVYAAGPGVAKMRATLPPSDVGGVVDRASIPTDDWPFLYLKDRHVPGIFLWMGAILAALSLGLVFRSGAAGERRFHLDFFAMGAGFLLLETKAVTQMSLLYGTTWFVNTVVFSIILLVILLSNLFVSRFPSQGLWAHRVGLALSLLGGYFFDASALLELGAPLRLLAALVVFGAPFFFASCLFARRFTETEQGELGSALGSNLLGSTMGGVSEYASLVLGIKALNLLALGYYLLSFAAARRAKS